MQDCGFPIINYDKNKTPLEWGQAHGEEFKTAIKELIEIRRGLMFDKNPNITGQVLDDLAAEQWQATAHMNHDIHHELEGIRQGSDVSISDIVILNNYTDFRDIQLPDEGCSVASISKDGAIFTGQTWDMHSSAKRFLSAINIPEKDGRPAHVAFSIVGCVGMMGLNSNGQFIGVNNINTDKARAGVIWPALIRHCLEATDYRDLSDRLLSARVTSGHNYILASNAISECWEVTPTDQERTGRVLVAENSQLFHTNHCLGERIKQLETPLAMNSTTHIRYKLVEKKITDVTDLDSLEQMFKDHENYPKSICSHFQSGAQDPSSTCGGGVFDMNKMFGKFWRGCPEHDSNFKQYSINFSEGGFTIS